MSPAVPLRSSCFREHSSYLQMCLFFFITHSLLIPVDVCVCVCVGFLWSPSRCLGATLLIRQAEEKLCFSAPSAAAAASLREQVPKLKDLP